MMDWKKTFGKSLAKLSQDYWRDCVKSRKFSVGIANDQAEI
jgi:hypothetical protein